MNDSDIYRCRNCGAWGFDTLCAYCSKASRGRCLFCDRPMRRRGWTKLQGWINYGGKGYCVTHYETVNKYGEEALEAELDEAVASYWRNRPFVLAGLDTDAEHR